MRLLMLTLLLASCSGDEPEAPATPDPVSPDPADLPPPTQPPAVETPAPVAEDPAAAARTRIGARHILVSYQGALGADKNLRRSRDEARKRAEELLQRVRGGEDFASVARSSSDDGTRSMGGDLGAFDKGAMNADFERPAFALKEGEISGVVETPFGFHIIQRYALNEIHVAHVLVQWSDIDKKAAKRTKEEARARAEEARARLQAGETVDQVARAYSDGPTGARGGDLGWFQKGQMMPAFDAAAFKLQPGQISEVVESPLGYHVIVRVE